MSRVAPEIFKAYDIRGVVGQTLTAEACELIGRAIGAEARALNYSRLALGRDGRLSGPELAGAVARGLQLSGVDVVDIGQANLGLAQAIGNGLRGKAGPMLHAPETLLLGGGDEFAVANERRR